MTDDQWRPLAHYATRYVTGIAEDDVADWTAQWDCVWAVDDTRVIEPATLAPSLYDLNDYRFWFGPGPAIADMDPDLWRDAA